MAQRTRSSKPRERGLPRGPQALPPEEVAADQRERLYEATISAVNERGFVATTISDLVANAGVSRRSFYEHFENKEECLLATYDALIGRLTARIAQAYDPEDEWIDQIEAIVRALFEASSDRPDAARLVSVEMGAAGPIGIERWARDAELLTTFFTSVFEHAPGEGSIPAPVARAIVGALRTILYSRVRRERSSRSLKLELQKLTPDIVAWIASFYPTPPEIPERPRPRRHGHLQGGRAPGHALALTAMGTKRPATRRAQPAKGLRGTQPARTDLRRGGKPDSRQRLPSAQPRGDRLRGGHFAANLLRALREQGGSVRSHIRDGPRQGHGSDQPVARSETVSGHRTCG